MGHRPMESDSPFPEIDSSHGGPSRDMIAMYLRQLRDESREVKADLKEHRENTSKALEEIRITIARMPSSCPKSDQCSEMWESVDQMKIDKAKQEGGLIVGKFVFGLVSSSIGALFALVVTYFQNKK